MVNGAGKVGRSSTPKVQLKATEKLKGNESFQEILNNNGKPQQEGVTKQEKQSQEEVANQDNQLQDGQQGNGKEEQGKEALLAGLVQLDPQLMQYLPQLIQGTNLAPTEEGGKTSLDGIKELVLVESSTAVPELTNKETKIVQDGSLGNIRDVFTQGDESLLGKKAEVAQGTDQQRMRSAEGQGTQRSLKEGMSLEQVKGLIEEVATKETKGANQGQGNIPALEAPIQQLLRPGQMQISDSSHLLRGHVSKQIVTKIMANLQQGSQQVTMQLNPQALGEITIKMVVEGDKISIQIDAKNQLTQSILGSQMNELKTTLQQHELQLTELNIYGQQDEGQQESNHSQESHDQDTREDDGGAVEEEGFWERFTEELATLSREGGAE